MWFGPDNWLGGCLYLNFPIEQGGTGNHGNLDRELKEMLVFGVQVAVGHCVDKRQLTEHH